MDRRLLQNLKKMVERGPWITVDLYVVIIVNRYAVQISPLRARLVQSHRTPSL